MITHRLSLGLLSAIALASAAAAQSYPAIDAATRTRVVASVADLVEANYFDAAKAEVFAEELRTASASGAYDDADDADALADALSQALRAHDRHFSVRHVGVRADAGDDDADEAEAIAAYLRAARRSNFGFQEVALLPGNVGYIDMRQFEGVQIAGETAIAALNFVKNADAVIFDMRENHGGDPSMVQFLISHFLDPNEPVVINTFVSRDRDFPEELRSLAHLPAGARPDTPLYVLTSHGTGSAGEAFPYHLQAMGRAEIIGETTVGAGNPGETFEAGDGFSVFISTGSARNPVTLTNWEGVGVQPDVEVPAADALDEALARAYARLAETAADPAQRTSLAWAREDLDARRHPPAYDVADFQDVLGAYGPRRLYADGGSLFYQRGERAPVRLTPLGDDRFIMDGLSDYRLTIQRAPDGAVRAIALEQPDSPPSVSTRSE